MNRDNLLTDYFELARLEAMGGSDQDDFTAIQWRNKELARLANVIDGMDIAPSDALDVIAAFVVQELDDVLYYEGEHN